MKQRKISPHLAALFAMFLFITTSSAAYLIIENNKPNSSQQSFNKQIETPILNTTDLPLTTTTVQPSNNLTTATKTGSLSTEQTIQPSNNSPTISHPEPEFISPIIFKVNNEEYKIEWQEKTSVYDLMNNLTSSSQKPFIFKAKEYPGMGMFVEEINGIQNNPKNNQHWIYYINGQSAKVGVSQYFIQKGDKIDWKYENANF